MMVFNDHVRSGAPPDVGGTDDHWVGTFWAYAFKQQVSAEQLGAHVPATMRNLLKRAAHAESNDRVLECVRQALGALPAPESEQAAVSHLRVLTDIGSMCAAVQAEQTESLRRMRVERERAAGVPAHRQCRGLAHEVALARRESPTEGSRHLRLAHALAHELPVTAQALRAGVIDERKALIVEAETVHVDARTRAEIERQAQEFFESAGPRTLAGRVQHLAEQADPMSAVMKYERSVKERRVTVRPAPGGMAYLTALLPLKEAVAVLKNLHDSATSVVATGKSGERTHWQVMADLLVERCTGQESASAVPLEIGVVMTDASLFGVDNLPAWVPGHGSIPAHVLRKALAGVVTADDERYAKVFLRRLFTKPESGQLVAMDSRRRDFPEQLRKMIFYRDGVCRTPWCEAPIKHVDHAQPHVAGGTTSWENASGLCASCNYVKENAGWKHCANAQSLTVTTPTGHHYQAHTGALLPDGRRW